MRWPVIGELPAPEVEELSGREAFELLVEHFDWTCEATIPMGLELAPTEEDEFTERLRRAGLAPPRRDDRWPT